MTALTDLGQIIDSAEEAIDIARVYLEIPALENLDRAEDLARQSLRIFQEFNRRKLEASAHKLLGEIYLVHAKRHRIDAKATADRFLEESLRIYLDLDLNQSAIEVEELSSCQDEPEYHSENS